MNPIVNAQYSRFPKFTLQYMKENAPQFAQKLLYDFRPGKVFWHEDFQDSLG